jgi:hypothetical protein
MTLFFRYGFVYLGLTLASALCVTERKSAFFEDEETDLFIEVDCFNVEPVLGPAPEGLSQQQVPSMHLQKPHQPLMAPMQKLSAHWLAPWTAVCFPTAGETVYIGIDTGE